MRGILPLLWSSPIGTASKFSVPAADNGMVYVGSRTGTLFGFGTKSNAALQAAPVNFGRVAVGTSKTLDVTVTANRSMTFEGVSPAQGVAAVPGVSGKAVPNTGPGFQGSTGSPGTTPLGPQNQEFTVRGPIHRRTLAAGQSVKIPVTFTPLGPGTVVAAIDVKSSAGTRALSVTGDGTAPGLVLSAPPITFGTLDTGAGGKTLTFTVTNSWDRPETVTGLRPPEPPFTVTGLPRIGAVLAPGQAVTGSITYDPVTAGSNSAFLQVASDHGSVSLPMTGAAQTGAAHLTLTPAAIDFGSIPVGRSVTLIFRIGNTGNIPLTISRAAAPSGVFSTATPLPEGLTLASGAAVTQKITFRPTGAGTFSGQYKFSAENGTGPVSVTFTGAGTAS